MPPLVLRAVRVHDGKHPMCVVTNVLSKTRLSDRQIVEIYKARWGVEIFQPHYDSSAAVYQAAA